VTLDLNRRWIALGLAAVAGFTAFMAKRDKVEDLIDTAREKLAA
jgi:hypothetical protein